MPFCWTISITIANTQMDIVGNVALHFSFTCSHECAPSKQLEAQSFYSAV